MARVAVIIVAFVVVCAGVGAALLLSGSPAKSSGNDGLYQVSTWDSLSKGRYESLVTVSDLLAHGNYGMGTFTGMDGEMIVVDGVSYQAGIDGQVRKASGDWGIPFAQVSFFSSEGTVRLDGSVNMSVVQSLIVGSLTSNSTFYMFVIEGVFDNITVRSVPVQEEPYPPLADVLAQQVKFNYTDIEGTIVGVWTPSYAAGSSTPGFHFHFISADRTKGGHVLGFDITDDSVQWDQLTQYTTVLMK